MIDLLCLFRFLHSFRDETFDFRMNWVSQQIADSATICPRLPFQRSVDLNGSVRVVFCDRPKQRRIFLERRWFRFSRYDDACFVIA
jgi:hypothetical protein